MGQGKEVNEARSGRLRCRRKSVTYLRGLKAARGPASPARPGRQGDMPETLQQAQGSRL